MTSKIFLALIPLFLFFSCKKDETIEENQAKLIVKLDVDPNQERLGNLGTAVDIPAGCARSVWGRGGC